MKIEAILLFENDQKDNTWYSNRDRVDEEDLQIHLSQNLYFAMGKPPALKIQIEGIIRE